VIEEKLREAASIQRKCVSREMNHISPQHPIILVLSMRLTNVNFGKFIVRYWRV